MRFRAYLNLSGTTHVHRHDCRDLRRLHRSQHDEPYQIDYELPEGASPAVRALAAHLIAEEIYADQIDEGMEAETAPEDVKFAPCTTIPAPEAPRADARAAVVAEIADRHAAALRMARDLPGMRAALEEVGQVWSGQITDLIADDFPIYSLGRLEESRDLTFFVHSHDDVATLLALLRTA